MSSRTSWRAPGEPAGVFRVRPTDEQAAALSLFLAGEDMVIDAGAGTGKTSTLRLLASSTRRRGRYLVFSRALADEVAGKMPERCASGTAHSLAFRAVGRRYRHRLNAERMRSEQIARQLGIDPLIVNGKRLAPGWQAGHVMRAIATFCATAHEEPSARHFSYVDGIDDPDNQGNPTYGHNIELARHLEGALRKAWQDLASRQGQLRFGHHVYLKLFQLSHPTITADYILFDEAQDASPVMAAIVAEQDHAQKVYVGDANQAIFRFTGAVDAMEGFDSTNRRSLTQSFRFGPAIADRANGVLAALDSPLRLRGLDSIDSTVGELPDDAPVDALLCRTNATAIEEVLRYVNAGQPVHLVGGGIEVAAFARGARELKAQGYTSYWELSCFSTWGEVLDYVQKDPNGSELGLMARLVEEFGTATILRAVDSSAPEAPGVMAVSTAHRSKGKEWPVVRIAEDMVDVDLTVDELRLRYVAFTRARLHLDDGVFRAGVERTEGAA